MVNKQDIIFENINIETVVFAETALISQGFDNKWLEIITRQIYQHFSQFKFWPNFLCNKTFSNHKKVPVNLISKFDG